MFIVTSSLLPTIMKKMLLSIITLGVMLVVASAEIGVQPLPISYASTSRSDQTTQPALARIQATIEQAPTSATLTHSAFIPYHGTSPQKTPVRYTAALHNGTIFVADDALTYAFAQQQRGWILKERFVGAAPFHIVPDTTTATPVSFFHGNDPSTWQQNLSMYAALSLGAIYPGVQMYLRTTFGTVEKVFVVEPGASPDVISVQTDGALALHLASNGSLAITTGIGTIAMSPPVAYQYINNTRTPVAIAYALTEHAQTTMTYQFTVGAYNTSYPLVIDPMLSATFIGGDGIEYISDVTTDSSGNIYITGKSYQTSTLVLPYPTTTGAYSTTLQADYDVVVSKFDPTLSTLLASTFIGGKQGEGGYGIAIDANGNVVVVGGCFSLDYPTTPGAYDTSHDTESFSRTDGFISIFDTNLTTLITSTLIGGYGYGELFDVTISPTGDIYVAGNSGTTVASYQQPLPQGYQMTESAWGDGMVVRFSPDLTKVTGFSLLGGNNMDYTQNLALDSAGNVFIIGMSISTNFPTTPGAFRTTATGRTYLVYVAQFSPDLTQLHAATFVGTVNAEGTPLDIAIGKNDTVYITGATADTTFPATVGAYHATHESGRDMFITRLSNDLTTVEAGTFVSGNGTEETGVSIAYDAITNSVFVAGHGIGSSYGFPTTVGAYRENHLNYDDTFVMRFNADLTRLFASTLYGGTNVDNVSSMTFDSAGNPIIVGVTHSHDFAVTDSAYDTTHVGGNLDGFVVKMSPALGNGGLVVSMPTTRNAAPGQSATFLVRYRNTSEKTIDNAVVVVDIPPLLPYVSSTGGGIYYPAGGMGGQVFWKVGTLPPLTGGDLSFTIDIPWGTQEGTTNLFARTSAMSIETPLFDVQPYLDFVPIEETSRYLTTDEIALLRATSPISEVLATANTAGYHFFNVATTTTRNNDQHITQLHLIGEKGIATLVTDAIPDVPVTTATIAFVEAFQGNTYTMFDQYGGQVWDRANGTLLPWGAWATADTNTMLLSAMPNINANTHTPLAFTGLREGHCQFNCTLNSIPETAAGALIDIYDTYSYIKDCKTCMQSYRANPAQPDHQACEKCTAATATNICNTNEKIAKKYPNLGTLVGWAFTIKHCLEDCVKDPSKHICTGEKRECCTGFWSETVRNYRGIDSVCVTGCNDTIGLYYPVSTQIYCDRFSEGPRCINGKCVAECESPACKQTTLTVRVPYDPNMKSSNVVGNVLAGQNITYTIDYENVGSGTAEDVYVLDVLDKSLDETTMVLGDGANSASYSAQSRTLSWDIGTLAAGEKGHVTFGIMVKQGLQDGTDVVNVATVYFPSSLEETPTNPVVHRVSSVVAIPQTVETAGVPVPITLSGKDAGGAMLSYAIVQEPLYGTLSGTPPAVTYTPSEHFVGQDRFSFSASNANNANNSADITINVLPMPSDNTPPQVITTVPAADASGVQVGIIQATYNEPLDATSVTTATFQVATSEGRVAGTVAYDALAHTATFYPEEPFALHTTYNITLTTMRDANGNALTMPFTWQFTTTSSNHIMVMLPLQATTLHFSEALTDTSHIVSVSSIGSEPVAIGTIVLSGTNTADFTIAVDTCSNQSLASQQSCAVIVSFTPQKIGDSTRESVLVIPSNDGDTPNITVPLVGVALAHEDDIPPVPTIYLPLILR